MPRSRTTGGRPRGSMPRSHRPTRHTSALRSPLPPTPGRGLGAEVTQRMPRSSTHPDHAASPPLSLCRLEMAPQYSVQFLHGSLRRIVGAQLPCYPHVPRRHHAPLHRANRVCTPSHATSCHVERRIVATWHHMDGRHAISMPRHAPRPPAPARARDGAPGKCAPSQAPSRARTQPRQPRRERRHGRARSLASLDLSAVMGAHAASLAST